MVFDTCSIIPTLNPLISQSYCANFGNGIFIDSGFIISFTKFIQDLKVLVSYYEYYNSNPNADFLNPDNQTLYTNQNMTKLNNNILNILNLEESNEAGLTFNQEILVSLFAKPIFTEFSNQFVNSIDSLYDKFYSSNTILLIFLVIEIAAVYLFFWIPTFLKMKNDVKEY